MFLKMVLGNNAIFEIIMIPEKIKIQLNIKLCVLKLIK